MEKNVKIVIVNRQEVLCGAFRVDLKAQTVWIE